jgi:polysaccharide export outer membrane protein
MMGSAKDRFASILRGAACCTLLLAFAAGVLCAEEQAPPAGDESTPPAQAAPTPVVAPPVTPALVAPAPVAPTPVLPPLVTPAGVEGPRLIFGEYRIQPGDRLYMSVWGEPSLTSDTIVMTHGRVPFPLLGEAMAAGKTVSELTEEVRQGYLRYYRDPKVSLFVTPVVWPSVYVQGNVRLPGPVEYSPGRRLLDYIGMAGGFAADADFSQIGIVSHENGRAVKTTVDMSAVSSDGESTPNPVLKPGDTVWIGRALPVSVLGAVNRPGAVDYHHGLRLSDYVGMAGGPTNRAELGKVLVKRTAPGGPGSVARVDLGAALGQPDDPKVNPVLGPGDTVTVPERFVAGTLEWRDVLRAVVGVFIWD